MLIILFGASKKKKGLKIHYIKKNMNKKWYRTIQKTWFSDN